MSKRNVTDATKKLIAGKQTYKCENSPTNKYSMLNDYKCPLWLREGDGSFDEAGYEIDHIMEFCLSKNCNQDNLQALCMSCHTVKTKRFNIIRRKINTEYEIEHIDAVNTYIHCREVIKKLITLYNNYKFYVGTTRNLTQILENSKCNKLYILCKISNNNDKKFIIKKIREKYDSIGKGQLTKLKDRVHYLYLQLFENE